MYVLVFLLLCGLLMAGLLFNAALLAPFFSIVLRLWAVLLGALLVGKLAFELLCLLGRVWAGGRRSTPQFGGPTTP